ncbi:RNA-directed DNA polymerase, eukaryota, reverse transcriptase zinc-binding domain protein [Tanacetum coccineum]
MRGARGRAYAIDGGICGASVWRQQWMRRWCWCRGGYDGGYRQVAARGGGDRIDRVMRNVFGLGRKTRRKSFPVAGGGAGAAVVVAGKRERDGGGDDNVMMMMVVWCGLSWSSGEKGGGVSWGGSGGGGAWWWGSGRSGDGELFWTWPEYSPEKFSGGGGGDDGRNPAGGDSPEKLREREVFMSNAQLKMTREEEITWKEFKRLLHQEYYPMGYSQDRWSRWHNHRQQRGQSNDRGRHNVATIISNDVVDLGQVEEVDKSLTLMVKPTSGVAKEKEELFTLKIQVKQEWIEAIVDTGSAKNLISSSLVEHLGLETTPHPRPYSLGWIKKDVDTQYELEKDGNKYIVNKSNIMKDDDLVKAFQARRMVDSKISFKRVPAQSIGSSNTDVLDSPCLLVLITGTSQSRQHVITSLIHIESCKSPTMSLFDVGSSRISIFTVNT